MKKILTAVTSLLFSSSPSADAASLHEMLQIGAVNGDIVQVKNALKKGAAVNFRDEWHRTALIDAANHGRYEIAVLLIEHGADVNSADLAKRTPLSEAVSHGHQKVVELLLVHNADRKVVDEDGRNLLMLGCADRQRSIVILLQ